jgi:hypothetical protein
MCKVSFPKLNNFIQGLVVDTLQPPFYEANTALQYKQWEEVGNE